MYNIIPYVSISNLTLVPYIQPTWLDIFKPSSITLPWTDKVKKLTQAVLKLPQADVKFIHEFEEGKYIRTMIVPPNTVVTGAEHKTPYKVILKQGKIAVNTDDGVKVLEAPLEMDVASGIERAGLTFDEEVIWADIYDNPDNCHNLEELEERLFVLPEEGLLNHRLLIDDARKDYLFFLDQYGLDEPTVRLLSEQKEDLIEMPEGFFTEIKKSKIEGLGLFVTKDISVGEVVCPARLEGKRTPGGRFVNHSSESNVYPMKEKDDLYLIAGRAMYVGEEILVDYNQMLKVNFGTEEESV